MTDQSGMDWVALIAYLIDHASEDSKQKLLRILDGEIGEDELKAILEKGGFGDRPQL